MKSCPYCHETTRQNKAGKTEAVTQRYRFMHCHHKYTPEPKAQGYPESVRKRALEMYVNGGNEIIAADPSEEFGYLSAAYR